MTTNLLFAGFGGQGILFAGKVMAYTGLIEDKQVTWLPSYGPEMRGGTANCSVCLSDEPIGCPMVVQPGILVVMNLPSYDKFIGQVAAGGQVVYDSALISRSSSREDISCHGIPATQLANDHHLEGLANMIVLGFLLQLTQFTNYDNVVAALEQCVPKSKAHLMESNYKALKIGYEYAIA